MGPAIVSTGSASVFRRAGSPPPLTQGRDRLDPVGRLRLPRRPRVPRLDPVGRLRLPRRPTLLRLAAVALLLIIAAAALATGTGVSDPQAPAAAGPTGQPGVTGHAGPRDQASPTPADRHAVPDHGEARGPGAEPSGGRLPIPAGAVGVPVRLGDPAGISLLRPGDRVDLLAVATTGEIAALATGVAVLAVDGAAAALLLALTDDQSRAVVAAAATATFAVTIRGW